VKRRHQGAQDTSPHGRIRLEAAIGRDAAAVIATSTDEVFELLRLGVPRDLVSVVPCGVDLKNFTVDGPVVERSNRPRLLYVGRLVERKGVDTIIRALGAIPKAELLIAGGPPANKLRSDRDVRRLRAIARERGVSRRVKFLGRVCHDELPPLMRSADAVVCVPWYEPFGIVPLEAMACGVPVVAAAVGGLVDTIINGTTGLLVPPRQPGALAKAIRDLLAEPTLSYAYGIAGSDRARSRYSWERVAKETLAVYKRVRAVRAEHRAAQGGA
jgi:D-inositol-3-phosphate glycosyltransferase